MRDALGLVGDESGAHMSRECALMVNGVPVHQDAGWLEARRADGRSVSQIADEAECSYHTARKWLAIHGLKFSRAERYPKGRKPWNAGLSGYDLSNLVSVCGACHRAIHRSYASEIDFAQHLLGVGSVEQNAPRRTRGWKLAAHAVEVVEVAFVGLRQTYDLCVEGPWHNFVANGIVVHNSFNEFSLRYAKATDEFYVPEPDDVRTQVGKPGSYSFEPVDDGVAETTRETLSAVYATAYEAYERLVELGVARELARSVLPVGAYTEFYWTVNARSLMNFVSLRAAEPAQREIRRYAEACERFFTERMPLTHAAFEAAGRVAP
jgi:hypothetical protein